MKIADLSDLKLHKNEIEEMRKLEIAFDISVEAGKIVDEHDIRAFALVCIDAKGSSHCIWDTGSIMPLWAFAPTIERCLERDISESGVLETWRPPLPVRG